MTKKKFLSFVLAIVLMLPCVFMFSACGGKKNDDKGARFANAIAINKHFELPILESHQFVRTDELNVEANQTLSFTFTKSEIAGGGEYGIYFVDFRASDLDDLNALNAENIHEGSFELYKSTDLNTKIPSPSFNNGGFEFDSLENGTYYFSIKFASAKSSMMVVVGYK